MARTFTSTPSYASVQTGVVLTHPFTMACWFYAANVTQGHPLLWVGDKDATNYYSAVYAAGATAGDPVGAYAHQYSGGGSGLATTTTGFSASTWHHACGVFTNTQSRDAYIDGGSKGNNGNTTGAAANHDRTAIGAWLDSSPDYAPANITIAEAAFWDVALTDAEVASLGDGWAPSLVRPQNLVAYVPLVGYASTEVDVVGGNAFALTGSPAAAAHPRMIYSRRHRIYVPAAAVGAVTRDPGVGSGTLTGQAPTRQLGIYRAPTAGEAAMAGAAASLMHLQYARPISDVAAGGWLPSTGIDLYPMIDEPSPASDSDYIYSTTTPDDETAIVDVTALTDTPGAGTTTLRIRAKKT